MAGTTVYDFLPFLLYSHVDTHFESSCCEGAVHRLHTYTLYGSEAYVASEEVVVHDLGR